MGKRRKLYVSCRKVDLLSNTYADVHEENDVVFIHELRSVVVVQEQRGVVAVLQQKGAILIRVSGHKLNKSHLKPLILPGGSLLPQPEDAVLG